MTRKHRYFFLQGIFSVWFILLHLPIIYNASEFMPILRIHVFKAFCHQLMDRFFVFYESYPLVCARCYGIYLGLVLFSFIPLRLVKPFIFLFLLAITLDKSLELFFYISNEIRFISGLLFSIPFVYFLQKKLRFYETLTP